MNLIVDLDSAGMFLGCSRTGRNHLFSKGKDESFCGVGLSNCETFHQPGRKLLPLCPRCFLLAQNQGGLAVYSEVKRIGYDGYDGYDGYHG